MAWKIAKKEDAPSLAPTMKEVKEHINDDFEDLESQEIKLQEQLKKIEAMKIEEQSKKRPEEPQNEMIKQELIDRIEGTMARLSQLVEMLRRV